MRRLLLLAALLLPACSDGVRPPVTAAPTIPAAPALTVPRPGGLVGLDPSPWHDATYVDPWTFDVHWTAGVEECYRLSEVRVAETATTVTVTLVVGSPRPPSGTQVCRAIGVNARTRVTLTEPLRERRLVDGARGEVRRLRAG